MIIRSKHSARMGLCDLPDQTRWALVVSLLKEDMAMTQYDFTLPG